MEEAEELASRTAILHNGEVLILGTNDYIRRQFGIGYKLDIFGSEEEELNKEEIDALVRKHIENA